jgi:formylglycine-generating enzyme required for sulfatase activity
VDSLPITWNEMLEFIKENPRNVIEKMINIRLLDNNQVELRVSESIWSGLETSGDTPALVSLEVAKLFVHWKNEKGIKCRIMTEEEYDSMASALKDTNKGNIDFKNYHTTPVGFYDDYSDDGVGELIGNGWELTVSPFRPFEGFKAMDIYKEYSADFFTDNHYVLKGASPFTSASLCRKSFRNWYQFNYVYHISKFRLVYDEI